MSRAVAQTHRVSAVALVVVLVLLVGLGVVIVTLAACVES